MITRRPPATAYERPSPLREPAAPPRRPAPWWRVTLDLVADGEREVRTRVYQAATRQDALEAALDEFTADCGPPDEVRGETAVRVAAPRD